MATTKELEDGTKIKYIVQTLGGTVISIRNSKLFARADVHRAGERGETCVVLEVIVKDIIAGTDI